MAINANIDKIGDLPKPLIEPLPLIVGVYYGKEFRTYHYIETTDISEHTVTHDIQLGNANVSLFNYILSNMFEKVLQFQHLPECTNSIDKIDLIIEPTVDYFSPWNAVTLTYVINFYMPAGEKTSWQITGRSGDYYSFGYQGIISKNAKLVMRDVAAQFFVEFCNQDDIKKRFGKQCNQ